MKADVTALYTPGPWQVRVSKMFHCIEAFSGTIAFVQKKKRNERYKADATLMAAAPELLAAANAAWNCIAELSPTQARVEVAQMLQAAVAKAVGEQP